MAAVIGAMNGFLVGWLAGMAGFNFWQSTGFGALSSVLACALAWVVVTQ